jgi:hypothetical protein
MEYIPGVSTPTLNPFVGVVKFPPVVIQKNDTPFMLLIELIVA